MSGEDPYYTLARAIQKQDRQTAAVNLAQMQQQIVDMVIEEACCLVADSDGDLKRLSSDIKRIRLKGKQFAHDRTHLRRAEAILNVLARKADAVKECDVRGIFDAGDGVEYETRDGEIRLRIHPRKFSL